jgi:hypothetical protein
MRTSILRPGLLVVVNSHVEAGITYTRTAVEPSAEIVVSEQATVTQWITTKIVPDAAEKKRADDARRKACAEIYKLCAKSRYVYVCPIEREGELADAEARARQIVDAHNASSVGTRIDFFPSAWLMADKNESTIRKIAAEMVELLADMTRGIDAANPDAIREAMKRAEEMAPMLGEEQVKAVSDAVEQARKAARDITRRVQKKGEAVASVIRDVQRGAIERARFAFLDTEETATAEGSMPAANVQRFAELDACGDDAPVSEPTSEPGEPTSEPGEVIAASA